MQNTLLDLSKKIDRATVQLFETIAAVAGSFHVPFYVVGATTRDIILNLGYGVPAIRATQDVDLAVRVSDWKVYAGLRERLIATKEFKPDTKRAQRLLYRETFPVDVIPFGEIALPDDQLLWPPDGDIKMSTLGFEEASESFIVVRMRAEPVLEINFASLAGLAILKIISWDEDKSRRDKDAKDLLLIMSKYLDAGNEDRLFDEEADLAESDDFDYELAGARLLGRDMAAILRPKTKSVLLHILEKETEERSRHNLIANMLDYGAGRRDFERALRFLEQMKTGILERP